MFLLVPWSPVQGAASNGDMKELAGIIHNTWYLSKQQCSFSSFGDFVWEQPLAVSLVDLGANLDQARTGAMCTGVAAAAPEMGSTVFRCSKPEARRLDKADSGPQLGSQRFSRLSNPWDAEERCLVSNVLKKIYSFRQCLYFSGAGSKRFSPQDRPRRLSGGCARKSSRLILVLQRKLYYLGCYTPHPVTTWKTSCC